ncbi:unnamed protein product, partial [Heterosigma akashiwo]
MQILIKNLIGKWITFDVEPETMVEHLKERIFLHEEILLPIRLQRLLISGGKLEDGRTLASYNIKQESMIHLVMRLLGMISSFTSTDTTNLATAYLMLTDEQRKEVEPPLQTLNQLVLEKGASCNRTFTFCEDFEILSPQQISLFCAMLEYMWDVTTPANRSESRVDMKLVVPDVLLRSLLEMTMDRHLCSDSIYRSHRVVQNLKRLYQGSSKAKIALRMTRGPTNACISFHCDGPYASSTTQIALNPESEYEGGRLCFYARGELTVLSRKPGSYSHHPPNVLHGVTSLISGTRKSLFVLDVGNGLGEKDIIDVTPEHIAAFI